MSKYRNAVIINTQYQRFINIHHYKSFPQIKTKNCKNDPNINLEIVDQTISCDKYVRPILETHNDHIEMLFKQSAYYSIKFLNTEIVKTTAKRLDDIFFKHFNVKSLQKKKMMNYCNI